MAKNKILRFVVVAAVIIALQSFVGATITSTLPAFGFGDFTLASILTVGLGVFLGQMAADKLKL